MIYDIADNGSRTVAVGSNGLILVSNDSGATWETIASGVTNALFGVAFGFAYDEDRWMIVGENGIILNSPDGYNWTLRAPFTGNTLRSVAWAGVFLAVGDRGRLGLSADLGQTWEAKSSGTTVNLYDITVDAGIYAIVGAEETVIIGVLNTLEKEVVVTEVCFASANEEETGTFNHSQLENIDTSDGYGWRHINGALVATEGGSVQHAYLTDGFGAYDLGVELQGTMNHHISEAISILQSIPTNGIFRNSLTETTTYDDNTSNAYRITREIIETLQATETITSAQGILLLERVEMLAQLSNQGAFSRVLTEALTFRDSIVLSWLALIEETVTATDTAVDKFEIAERLVERMTASGAIESRLLAVASVAIALLITETVEGGKGADVTETITLTPALLDQFQAYCLAIESVTMTATPEMTLRLSMPITETATLTGDGTAQGFFRDLLTEGLSFELLFNSGSETFRGWVMNTENFGVTEYQDYPFNSLTKFNGVYLGANSNGVYRLEGSDDAGSPIAAALKTGVSLFPAKTNIPEVFLSFRSSGGMIIKTITDEKIERWYSVTGTEYISRKRAKMALGVKSSYWQFELTNVDGATLELESIELVPVVLSRKI